MHITAKPLVILYACQAPQRVCIREIVICPTKQQP